MQICYFFYKNIVFGTTIFLYEAYASFSAQPAYNDWYLSLYNVFFTSLLVVALGVFDQDVSSRFCLKVLKIQILYLFYLMETRLIRVFFFLTYENLEKCDEQVICVYNSAWKDCKYCCYWIHISLFKFVFFLWWRSFVQGLSGRS